MKKNVEVNTNSFSTINASTKIVGEIHSDSDLRIDGNVEGNVQSKAKVVLGASAYINGNISSQNADVSCTVIGNIYIEDLLKLNATANIKGDIFANKLIVESGASFTGRCEMGGDVKMKDHPRSENTLFAKAPEKIEEE
ncbi:MAG: polymer-forming cytoskeletal protein [Bacteroidetes bacterium]|mgnify:CR=1|jgi:cytoskeletal protein CcmA (bactofilin family)|nr:polymer-forming cytoskeletal protein [Bacteroidota bacterium]MBT5530400.1 polymer-forming cytoskeletal protein [Cytophagia bacterium]MBT3423658.1 polymer-forming cytoskeletal protein [Bacteroidota bacterium]MBT3799589.1 polymer-forming cytoskeletal protein [Bacteroidota bacterium]MBT3935673.1 polymer-forming cytoskeletal protein [Bacteroidota bacterium]